MKRMGIIILAVLISSGLVAVMGGCGGGGGGGGLPKSSPTYEGPNNPSVIDTSTVLSYLTLPSGIGSLVSEIQLDAVISTSDTIPGSESGSVTYWERQEWTESATRDTWKGQMRITFDNFVDDGEAFEGILVGAGSLYFEEREDETFTGEMMTGIGDTLTGNYLSHMNFSDFYYSSTKGEREERSGWSTSEWDVDYADGTWNTQYGADIALADYAGNRYLAVLGATASMEWDGSFTTYMAQGTICGEGDVESDIVGCVDVDWNLVWDQESQEGEPILDYPLDGYLEVSTIEASAMFEFGSSDSNPTCFIISIDADGDGSYAGTGETGDVDHEEVCDEPWPGSE